MQGNTNKLDSIKNQLDLYLTRGRLKGALSFTYHPDNTWIIESNGSQMQVTLVNDRIVTITSLIIKKLSGTQKNINLFLQDLLRLNNEIVALKFTMQGDYVLLTTEIETAYLNPKTFFSSILYFHESEKNRIRPFIANLKIKYKVNEIE